MERDYQISELQALEDFEEYGSELVPYSGALVDRKLDLVLRLGKLWNYLISNKFTAQKSISFKLDDLKKDRQQAKIMGKKLFRRIEFSNGEKYILIDQDWFKELLLDG